MKGITITHPDTKKLSAEISLPHSKSESNRALIINALSGNVCNIQNLSDADDTILLQKLLSSNADEANCENAGTVLRFLTAYYCSTQQEKVITGSERMLLRPIGKLVDALKTLGADITYLDKEGFPPIRIKPSSLSKQNKVSIDASESSQFVSALMMIAPSLDKGLEITLTNAISSQPYISMTAQMMVQSGIMVKQEENSIVIKKQKYAATNFTINADWSAAAFIYEIAALSNNAEITINNLLPNSFQGDEVTKEIFKLFGVKTSNNKSGIVITKTKSVVPDYFTFNFTNTPDLALPVAATCGGLNVVSDLHGLKNLVIKRIQQGLCFSAGGLQTEY
ncbi:MAG: 3-phosphoshikimate 1-carboxyvinyltransferase [Bacteroidetes bacterium]|nr:3-phosphoshikimate 1-carboxyvinyltransferase [Bacteroidota bacterium]